MNGEILYDLIRTKPNKTNKVFLLHLRLDSSMISVQLSVVSILHIHRPVDWDSDRVWIIRIGQLLGVGLAIHLTLDNEIPYRSQKKYPN